MLSGMNPPGIMEMVSGMILNGSLKHFFGFRYHGNFRAVRLGAPFQLSLAGIHLTLFPKKSERKSHFKLVCD